MTGYPYSEFDGGEDAADDREAWFLARRAFVDGVELDAPEAWFIARGVSPGRVELDAPEEES